MPEKLEEYVIKTFEEAKEFLQKNFPEIYEDIDLKIELKYEKRKTKFDYDIEYRPRKKKVTFKSYKKTRKPKNKDIITNAFGIRMRRKNSYLISMIHEIGEAWYMKELTKRNMKITFYDIDVSHDVATSLELHSLEKLIGQSEGRDKKDFIKRKKARLKEIKRRKLKGV